MPFHAIVFKYSFAAALVVFVSAALGCASTQSTRAPALKQPEAQALDLRRFQTVTIVPFQINPEKVKDPEIATNFGADIGARLRNDFGPLFATVRLGEPLQKSDELILTGTVTKYRPGSITGRVLLMGVGSAGLEAEVLLKDGRSGDELLRAPIDKLWAWGGFAGAAKDIDRMSAEAAAVVANTIARAKGWQPPNAK